MLFFTRRREGAKKEWFTRRRGGAEKKGGRDSGIQYLHPAAFPAADAAQSISANPDTSAPPRLRANISLLLFAPSRLRVNR